MFYNRLLKNISNSDTINILKFTEFCDKNYERFEQIKQMDITDECYRVSKKIPNRNFLYSNIYNPVWFTPLIRKVANEKAIQDCILHINNLKEQKSKSEYKTIEIKNAEDELNRLIEDIKKDTKKTDEEVYEQLINDISKNNENIRGVIGNLSGIYYERFNSIFDITPKYNCCNCISIVLYLKGNINSRIGYLTMALNTMSMSLYNVDKYLINFI
jgi:hypothetical protein